jgi:ubiquinone/menaquinone biosynthesis C-methylase UbiE
MNFQDTFTGYKSLSSFEKFVFRTCTYLPPRAKSDINKLHAYHPMTWYLKNYQKAFGHQFVEFIKGKRVLDFGCGFGGYVLAMGAMGAAQSFGVEISDIVEEGKKKAYDLGLNNVMFLTGNSSLFEENSFDLITSHDAFEHFENPKEILIEMIRLVKPGGEVLVKFGPTWLSPWGKHMNGTFKKNRPWIHLFIPEKSIMRVHSVYHNQSILLEKYNQRPGGLNQMTVRKSKKIINSLTNVEVENFEVHMLFDWNWMRFVPLIKELMSSWVFFKLKKL